MPETENVNRGTDEGDEWQHKAQEQEQHKRVLPAKTGIAQRVDRVLVGKRLFEIEALDQRP